MAPQTHRSKMDPPTDSDSVSRRKDGDYDVSAEDDCEDFEVRRERVLPLGGQTPKVSHSMTCQSLSTGTRASETRCRMGGWNA